MMSTHLLAFVQSSVSMLSIKPGNTAVVKRAISWTNWKGRRIGWVRRR